MAKLGLDFSRPKLRPEILLLPQIPKPLHGLNPRTILGQKWWDRTRMEAYRRQNYYCLACGVHKSQAKYHQWLEAHEVYEYDYKRGIGRCVEIVALCNSCHSYIHQGLLQMKAERGEISAKQYRDILAHGDRVLEDVPPGHRNEMPDSSQVQQDWTKWHLVLHGHAYKSKFTSYEDWQRFYS